MEKKHVDLPARSLVGSASRALDCGPGLIWPFPKDWRNPGKRVKRISKREQREEVGEAKW